MTIAIIAAMQKELDLILGLMRRQGDITTEEFEGVEIHRGRIADKDVVAAKCGIGKVNSALRTDTVIRYCHPDLLVNSGVAGGADASMHIGDVLVADGVAYHEVWCGPGTEPGAADGYPRVLVPAERYIASMRSLHSDGSEGYRYGLICSGDRFISTPEEVERIKSLFPDALGCDMESASIAQTCIRRNVPFMVVRVMSDMPGGGENISEYNNFWNDAPVATFKAVESLIENI